MQRAVTDYLAETDAPTPEREYFVKLAARFYRTAAPDVREWVTRSMEATVKEKGK